MMFKTSKRNIFVVIACFVVFLAIFFYSAESTRRDLLTKYEIGKSMVDNGDYQNGINILIRLGDYQDSLLYIEKARNRIEYDQAVSMFSERKYEEARIIFERLEDKDIANITNQEETPESYVSEINKLINSQKEKEQKYSDAVECFDSGNYKTAYSLLISINGYSEEVDAMLEKCIEYIKRLSLSKTISAGVRFSAGVTEDSKIEFAGIDPGYKEVLLEWDNIISISAKGHFIIGLKKDGSVVTTGRIGNYRIDTSDWRDIIEVAAGELYIIGLKNDGTLTAQGHNGDKQIDIDEWTNIVSVAAGPRHTVGLDKDGNIYITGYGSGNQLKNIADHKDEWTNIIAIAAGGRSQSYTAALKKDGTVVVAYQNGLHRFSVNDWTDIIAIAAGDSHIVGLKSNGHVVLATLDSKESEEIDGWEDIVAIDAGFGFTLGLTEKGEVKAIGNEWQGQIDVDDWRKIARREEWNFVLDDSFNFILGK